MAKIYDIEYIAGRNTRLRTESYDYVAGDKYYFNINRTPILNTGIIIISAGKSTLVEDGKQNTWQHAPVKTIINLKTNEVQIQDFVT